MTHAQLAHVAERHPVSDLERFNQIGNAKPISVRAELRGDVLDPDPACVAAIQPCRKI